MKESISTPPPDVAPLGRPTTLHPSRFPAGRLLITAMLGLALHLSASSAAGEVILSGTITDPIGDTPLADITSASLSIDSGGTITFTTLFAPGTFNPADGAVAFYLDTDGDWATGSSATYGGLGVDAFAHLNFLGPGVAFLGSLWNGLQFTYSTPSYVDTPISDGVMGTFQLSLFGAIDPDLRWAVSAWSSMNEAWGSDATAIGTVVGGGGGVGVPDSGSSLLLFSIALVGLLIGKFPRRLQGSLCASC